jgi:hypothetical protein
MRLIFCVREHTFDEIYMGHQLGFPAIRGIDAISATANARGFTPLTAIAGKYGWRDDLLEAASLKCNSRQEVAIVNAVSPTLLLVPKTSGNNGWPSIVDKLINDLLDGANYLNLRSLHFTHYGFIQGYPPGLEMIRILQAMMNPKRRSSLEVVYWDIDIRGLKELVNHYSMVARQFHINAARPDIYIAPKFTWHEVERTPGGLSVHVFADANETHAGRVH